jgi:peptidyl-prolyl cis-trans isomerase B (cyclophilin B)
MKKLSLIAVIIAFSVLIQYCSMAKDKKKMDKVKETNNYEYVISVTQGGKPLGEIEIKLLPDVAPKHVANFDSLVSAKFYDGTAFHRVIPGFMIQGGDPNSRSKPKSTWGMGEPGQTKVPAEFNQTSHKRGMLSAARSQDPNSASSQFFICVADANFLDGQYTVYGQVTKGMEVADAIVNTPRDSKDNPNEKVEMTIHKK